MAILKKAQLYKQEAEVKDLLQKYEIENAKIFGHLTDHSVGSTADLNLLVSFKNKSILPAEITERLIALERKLTALLATTNTDLIIVHVDTTDSLIKRSIRIGSSIFPNSQERVKQTVLAARPLENIFRQGEKDDGLYNQVHKLITDYKLHEITEAKTEAELSREQQQALIQLGNLHCDVVVGASDQDDTVYESLSDEEKAVIDYSENWDLHNAIANDMINRIKLILDLNPVSVGWVDEDGDTPLHRAIFDCNYAVAELLLDKEPNLVIKNKKDQTVFDVAICSLSDKLHIPAAKKLVNRLLLQPNIPQHFQDKFKAADIEMKHEPKEEGVKRKSSSNRTLLMEQHATAAEEQGIVISKTDEADESVEIPDYLKCPITKEWMRNPVVASDGHSYEKDALLTWIKVNPTSPMTRELLSEPERFPVNRNLKYVIVEFLKKHPKLKFEPATCSQEVIGQGYTLAKNKILAMASSFTDGGNLPAIPEPVIPSIASYRVMVPLSPTDSLKKEKEGNSLFIAIVYSNSLEEVKTIIQNNKDIIRHRDKFGANALLLAATHGRKEIFDWLTSPEAAGLELDARELTLEVRNSEGHTPFLAAVYGGELDFIQYLIEKYPTRNFLNEKDKFNRDAIQVADLYGHHAIADFLQQLKKKHIIENLMREEKWNLLLVNIYFNDLEEVKKILKHDKNAICHRDRFGANALLLAAAYGRKEIFDWLTSPEATELELDARELTLEVRNSEGHTPFLAAVYGGELGFIRYLIEKNSKRDFLNEKDKSNRDAIQIADLYGHHAIADFLRKLRKDPVVAIGNIQAGKNIQLVVLGPNPQLKAGNIMSGGSNFMMAIDPRVSSFAHASFLNIMKGTTSPNQELPLEITYRHPDLPENCAQFNTLAEGNCLFIAVCMQRLLQEINQPADSKGYPPRFGDAYRQLFGETGNLILKGKTDNQGNPLSTALNADITIAQVYNLLQDYDGNSLSLRATEGRILETLFCTIFRDRVVSYMQEHADLFRLTIEGVADENAWQNYLIRMAKPGTFGGQPEIRAMRYLLGAPIRVYRLGYAGFIDIERDAKAEGINRYPVPPLPICIVHVPATNKDLTDGELPSNHYHYAIDAACLPPRMKSEYESQHKKILSKYNITTNTTTTIPSSTSRVVAGSPFQNSTLVEIKRENATSTSSSSSMSRTTAPKKSKQERSMPELSGYLSSTAKMYELARLGYSWSTIVAGYVKPGAVETELKLMGDLVKYRDVIDCKLYEKAAEKLFPAESFTFAVRMNPTGVVRKTPDGHYTFTLKYYELAIYGVPYTGFNLDVNKPHCVITVQASGSRTLTSDIDTTLSVTGAEHIAEQWEWTAFILRSCTHADKNGAIRTAMIEQFYALSEAEYGMTSGTHRDSNVYSGGFLVDYPKLNENPIVAGQPFLSHPKEFYKNYKLRKHQLELAASLVSLRTSLSEEEWQQFKTQFEEELKQDDGELIPSTAHTKVKNDFAAVCQLTEGFYQHFTTALKAQEEKRVSDYPRGYPGRAPLAEGEERSKDIRIAALNDLYVEHLKRVDALNGEIITTSTKIKALAEGVASTRAELHDIKELMDGLQSTSKTNVHVQLRHDDATAYENLVTQQKALAAALQQKAALQNQKQEAQIRANLFANEAYINRSGSYHVVEEMQKQGDVALSKRTIIGSALQQIGFKLLHTRQLHEEEASEEKIAYKTAKYGHRVGDLLFGKTTAAYVPKVLSKMRLASPPVEVLKKLQGSSHQFNDYFTDEEYQLLNAELHIKHGIKDDSKVAESEKEAKTREFLQQRLTLKTGDKATVTTFGNTDFRNLREEKDIPLWLSIGTKTLIAGYSAKLTKKHGLLWSEAASLPVAVASLPIPAHGN